MDSATQTFVLDERDRIYVRVDQAPFEYSDGTEVERRILDILTKTGDLSTSSSELVAQVTDWPTEYHFSPVRHHLLRHLAIGRDHDLLEIGAGCGSITRLFGETGAKVVAVEGSLARARCARMRCRDLDNVSVYCTNLQDFGSKLQFDIVTLIGVLEYSPIYIKGDDPFLACLQLAARYLKPNGVLIVAIENQLGLKYFCGYPEDHVSKPYFGITDSYNSTTARTMGRVELRKVLERAGFAQVEYQYPFPDYKLPSIVFTEAAFEHQGFRPEEIIQQTRSRDYTGVRRDLVPEHLVWPGIGRNDLIRDLSNSFLVIASRGNATFMAQRSGLLAVGYTSDRASIFNTVREIYVAESGEVRISRRAFGPSTSSSTLLVHVPEDEPYVDGTHLASELDRRVQMDDWKGYLGYLQQWLEYLQSQSVREDKAAPVVEARLPQDFLDCLPKNIVTRGIHLHYFDREWVVNCDLFVGTVMLRFFLAALGDTATRSFLARNLVAIGRDDIVGILLNYLGLPMTDAVVQNYVRLTNAINSVVYPQKPPNSVEEIWSLVRSPQAESGDAKPAMLGGGNGHGGHKIAYWNFRSRMLRSGQFLKKAIKAWWE